jgi:hypothetical protein
VGEVAMGFVGAAMVTIAIFGGSFGMLISYVIVIGGEIFKQMNAIILPNE